MLGFIFANRDFFPDRLIDEARADIARLCASRGIEPLMLSPEDSKRGGVETQADARKCADLFRRNRDRIDGVVVVLANFGDERAVAQVLRDADLGVPVLIQAYPDDLNRLDVRHRRDGYCGKISVCNNLRQAGIPYSLTRRHVCRPLEAAFSADLAWFLAVCRVVRGMRRVRIGAVGARPGAFATVRYSEKILERHGISVLTVDLSEFLERAGRLAESDRALAAKVEEIRGYAHTGLVPPPKLIQMARLGVVLDRFVDDNGLDATAIQCWTSLQQNHGCNVCTSMSMMSEAGRPSACEVDVMGALTMRSLQLAAQSPAALVDWNNNYGDDADRCVLFHCGNWAKSFLAEPRIATAPILGTVVGEENTFGALEGRAPAGPLTFGRLTTDDSAGRIRGYVGQGELTADPLQTFGTCAVAEAWSKYLGWDVHRHP